MSTREEFIERMNNLERELTPIESAIFVYYSLSREEFLELPLGKINAMHLYLDNVAKICTTKSIEYYCISVLVPEYVNMHPKEFTISLNGEELGTYKGLNGVDACVSMFRERKDLSYCWFNFKYLTYKGYDLVVDEVITK